ncbi:Allergen V5/Tpx-1 related protein [Celeribacter indicus]|uniref:Allergen V5/Tpx-1 related protein n=2 Tax=Celeribacter indicus TaxID=1208324 RepID=A0A0B5DZU1_9RHOB|nr:Allergen V5/Tpx-1 related protein [Celeribacter indicus]
MENIVQIRARAEATVNNTRTARGLAPVTLDSALVAAADSHSRSMAQQRRAWHFGADGSSPMDRARRAGFVGEILGELVSETYESEVQAIATWMGSPAQRAVLLDPMARRIGMGVFQEPNNKLWWTLTVAN